VNGDLLGLVRRHRGAAAATGAAFVLIAATSDVVLALVAAASAGVVAAVVAKLPAPRRRPGIALVVLAAVVVTAGASHALSPGQPTVVVPAALVPPGSTAAQVAASLVDQQPNLASSWLLSGDTGDASSLSGSAFLGYERALILDPGDRRAALGLAGLYLARNQSLLDDEIATFFTRLAGYHAPSLHPAS